jgi:hypothetical protein
MASSPTSTKPSSASSKTSPTSTSNEAESRLEDAPFAPSEPEDTSRPRPGRGPLRWDAELTSPKTVRVGPAKVAPRETDGRPGWEGPSRRNIKHQAPRDAR